MEPSFIRESLLDRAVMHATVNRFIEEKMKAEDSNEIDEDEEKYLNILRFAMETFYPSAVENIFNHSESPIETIFLNSVLLSFLYHDPLGLIVWEPCPNMPEAIREHRERLRSLLDRENEIRARMNGKTGVVEYMKYLVDEGLIHEESYAQYKNEFICMHVLDYYHAFILVMQAGFPDIRVNGKSVRTDLFVYVPADTDFNMVVECDGFQYHSTKEKFIDDRQRDRLLKANGFDVLRFSGSEIYKDPAKAGIELYQYLQGLRMKHFPEADLS
jgi:very-short-patch-repair endonuclease